MMALLRTVHYWAEAASNNVIGLETMCGDMLTGLFVVRVDGDLVDVILMSSAAHAVAHLQLDGDTSAAELTC